MDKLDPRFLELLKQQSMQREKNILARNATFSTSAIRIRPELLHDDGYRQPFSLDADRILHSLAYTRYIDKTQVFYLIRNDHITHRVLHVQLVAKIARTIARFLCLNEDLVEAIALGHDIGHCPFGHDGEQFLSELCQLHGIGQFHHNLQSVQFLEKVERKGKGWNLCLQTLDGILCHDGEVHSHRLIPQTDKDFNTLTSEIELKKADGSIQITPMTPEGCVVRIADTISYIGRDIEDAIRLGLIKRKALPPECVVVLGNTNGTIVYSLVTDVIANSFQKGWISYGPKVADALKSLKKYNIQNIYCNPKIKEHTKEIKTLFSILFERYLADLSNSKRTSPIFKQYLEKMSSNYSDLHSYPEIVRDFIAGMTDRYFLSQFDAKMRPRVKLFQKI